MLVCSLYIHIPFCVHRCGYCDFNTYAGVEHLIPGYVQAVCSELEYLSEQSPRHLCIKTVYFGGGTPSLLSESHLENIITRINTYFSVVVPLEISLEANPGTVSRQYLDNIHSLGVNRISLGMQSAHSHELEMLERVHTFEVVRQAVEWSRSAGIDNLNLDLIFGLPAQTLSDWLESLQAAVDLQPEHLSLYALTLEPGTPMYRKVEKKLLPEPDGDLAADMYEAAGEMLSKAGFIQYEISNWARLDYIGELRACAHNLQYWRNLPYIGVGAGAHGYVHPYRIENIRSPAGYIGRLEHWQESHEAPGRFPSTPATDKLTRIDKEAEIGETMMTGLRLVNEGVSAKMFQWRFGISLQERFGKQIDRFISLGLLEWTEQPDQRLRLTTHGYLLGNQVFAEFI